MPSLLLATRLTISRSLGFKNVRPKVLYLCMPVPDSDIHVHYLLFHPRTVGNPAAVWVLHRVTRILQSVSVNYCHFELNSALAKANLFIWTQCQSNKQRLEFHIWVALWMTCSMWSPWDSRTARRHNIKFCKTRVSIPLVTCAQLSLILSFSSGRVRGALLNTLSFR